MLRFFSRGFAPGYKYFTPNGVSIINSTILIPNHTLLSLTTFLLLNCGKYALLHFEICYLPFTFYQTSRRSGRDFASLNFLSRRSSRDCSQSGFTSQARKDNFSFSPSPFPPTSMHMQQIHPGNFQWHRHVLLVQ